MAAERTASPKASGAATVDDFMRALDHPLKAEIDAVRKIIVAASPRIEEGVKWNAPSFRAGDWFATINLRSKGFVHVILHLGAKVGHDATTRMRAADPAGLLEWLAKDRAAIKLRDRDDIAARRESLIRIVQQWIEPR